ncbi:uncharacterized protein LOC142586983 isoform X1 [Dermacentor variabilis]|uniref:uncharacterized protein LOC142586983 isoform X1 n=1 Tax=Dermacentor variabilis TaxID=34621 RepID=UPI003F5B0DA8
MPSQGSRRRLREVPLSENGRRPAVAAADIRVIEDKCLWRRRRLHPAPPPRSSQAPTGRAVSDEIAEELENIRMMLEYLQQLMLELQQLLRQSLHRLYRRR